MRKVCFLSAGCLLTMAFSAFQAFLHAQSSYRPVVRPPTPSTPVIASSSSAKKSSEPPLSSIEMQIELAWLSDPITFPFDLKTRTSEGKVQVLGNVANQGTRDRALLLAGQFATVQVIDKMHIQGKLTGKGETVPAVDLQHAVAEALTREIGPISNQFEIKAHSSGQVSIAGDVATLEQKLAVSKSLRGTKGCVCVINLLNVAEPTSPTIAAVQESKRSIQDRLGSLFSNNSVKKETTPEAKTASTWKQTVPVGKSDVKPGPSSESPPINLASSKSPSSDFDRRLPNSAIKTVNLEERSADSPHLGTTSATEMTNEVKKQIETIEPVNEQTLPLKTKQPELSTDELKLEVEKICGKSAHNIQVSIKPDKSVVISLECKNKSDAEKLSKKILHLRMLAPFEVGLDINFEP